MNEPQPLPIAPTQAPPEGAAQDWNPVPQRFGRFAVQRLHAKGGLGEVHVAFDDELRRKVALKRIQDCRAADPAARRRFLNEAEITARLEHPGIVPIYGLVQDEQGQPCYAMRFIGGRSLGEAIRRFHSGAPGQPFDPRGSGFRALLQRFLSVCQTIAYAHSQQVIHRDIKPENVLLGPFGETLVVDWGLARELEVSSEKAEVGSEEIVAATTIIFKPSDGGDRVYTQTGQALGTPGYMAPEQAAGRLDALGPACDIYSLGATLYELLTNRRPVQGGTWPEIQQKTQRGDYPPPRQLNAQVPKPLEAICLRAMALAPKDRYASAADLAADLEHWLADEPVSAHAEPWHVRAGRWLRRHRTLVSSGVVALAVVTVSLGVGAGLLDAANGELRAANARAETNADRAALAQAQAEQGFNKAKEAVDKYLKEVAEDPQLKHTPGLHGLRERLLKAALPFFTWFTEQRPTEPQLRADQGWAFGRLASVHKELGDSKSALAHRKRHCDICAALVSDYPQSAEYHSDWGGALHNLAGELEGQGASEEARRLFEQALAEQQTAVQAEPRNTRYREFLAIHNNSLGILLLDLGQRPAAERAFRRALDLYQALAADFPTMALYRRDLAGTQSNLGNLLHQLGQDATADQAYRRALELQGKLATDFPNMPEYRDALATSHNNLGMLLNGLGQGPAAEEAFRQALDIQEKLAAEYPAVPVYRQQLALSHNNLGIVLMDQAQWLAAEQAYRRAIDVRKKLAADFPTVPQYRHDLARSYNNLGYLMASQDQSRRAEAEQAYREALDIQEKMASDFPTVPEYRTALAGSYINIGSLIRNQGKAAESLTWFAKGIQLLDPLLQQEPRLLTERFFLRNAHWNRAEALDKLARHADAVKDWDRALALNADPAAIPFLRSGRAQSLARTGEHAQAVAEANDLVATHKLNAGTLYDLACVCALSSAAVKDNAKLEEQYAARAVELLRQAVAKGYKDIEHLKKDDDLKALREREDYQRLIKEFAEKKKGP